MHSSLGWGFNHSQLRYKPISPSMMHNTTWVSITHSYAINLINMGTTLKEILGFNHSQLRYKLFDIIEIIYDFSVSITHSYAINGTILTSKTTCLWSFNHSQLRYKRTHSSRQFSALSSFNHSQLRYKRQDFAFQIHELCLVSITHSYAINYVLGIKSPPGMNRFNHSQLRYKQKPRYPPNSSWKVSITHSYAINTTVQQILTPA